VEKATGAPVPKLADLKKSKSPTSGFLLSPKNLILNKDNSLERIDEETGKSLTKIEGGLVNFSAIVNETNDYDNDKFEDPLGDEIQKVVTAAM
jgi:hypothetical protein